MLKPSHTLADLFKPGVVLVPRASRRHGGWLTQDPNLLEALTGTIQLLAGGLPMLCHEACLRAEWRTVYDGHLEIAESGTRRYAHERDYQARLGEMIEARELAVVQHRYPEAELPAAACLVSTELLGRLNDKACLEEWVSPEWLLSRRVMRPDASVRPEVWPQVLKAGGKMTSGGGVAVKICRDLTEWQKARRELSSAESLVWEKYQRPRRILGLQYAILADGQVHYWGATENQLIKYGYVHGNWIDAGALATPAMVEVGLQVMKKAAREGYRGVAGLDILEAEEGPFWVIDLNFRCLAGTPALLFSESVNREWRTPVLFSSLIAPRIPAQDFMRLMRREMDARRAFPLSCYIPGDESAQWSCILFAGKNRDEVGRRKKALESRFHRASRTSLWSRMRGRLWRYREATSGKVVT